MQAQFDRGVLEVQIPKPEQKKPRQVQINVGNGSVEADSIDQDVASADPQVDGRDPTAALT